MVRFSNDADIVKYEPILFGELYFPWQVLVSGSGGVLAGTSFTDGEGDFVSGGVAAGHVIYMRSEVAGLDMAAEVVSVESATELTVSVIRADLEGEAIAPRAATGVSYRISTFDPQASEAAFLLTEHYGLRPGNPAGEYDVSDILDTKVLKQVSVFAVLSGVYATLASKDKDENFWKKSLYYQKLYEKARGRCRLSIDVGSDGAADVIMLGSSGRLLRD